MLLSWLKFVAALGVHSQTDVILWIFIVMETHKGIMEIGVLVRTAYTPVTARRAQIGGLFQTISTTVFIAEHGSKSSSEKKEAF